LAGIAAIYNFGENKNSQQVLSYLITGMRMLQHRGKAYWKIMIGNNVIENKGSIPPDDILATTIKKQKITVSVHWDIFPKDLLIFQV